MQRDTEHCYQLVKGQENSTVCLWPPCWQRERCDQAVTLHRNKEHCDYFINVHRSTHCHSVVILQTNTDELPQPTQRTVTVTYLLSSLFKSRTSKYSVQIILSDARSKCSSFIHVKQSGTPVHYACCPHSVSSHTATNSIISDNQLVYLLRTSYVVLVTHIDGEIYAEGV